MLIVGLFISYTKCVGQNPATLSSYMYVMNVTEVKTTIVLTVIGSQLSYQYRGQVRDLIRLIRGVLHYYLVVKR